MSNEVLAYTWHILLAIVWSIYIIQETITVGVSMLTIKYDEKDIKKLNGLVGLHWDGIQVWLILAVAGLLAAFPPVMSAVFANLYVVIFLLLYIIIFRGVSIELIYKSSNEKFIKISTKVWQITSFLLILVIGIYLVNTFVGIKLADANSINSFFSFVYIFNMLGILGGVLLVAHSFVQAYNYISFNYKDDTAKRLKKISKYSSVVSSLTMIFILMGLNNEFEAFSRGLFQQYLVLFALPILAMILMMCSTIFVWLDKKVAAFITSNLSILFFVLTGFLSMIPYAVVPNGDSVGMLIVEGSASQNTLSVMLYVTLVFLPVVIGYQIFKYIRFWSGKK